jgi:PiT family inorganic phosphate transporter
MSDTIWFFLLSGIFLGWSLGANDAANVFGTAVGSKMVRFRAAAIIASVFVVVGAVLEGGGTTGTLGELGAVNALAGSFTVALAAGLTVACMTKWRLPVSTSQAIVGAILGWNLFTGSPTNHRPLLKIVGTWVFCPVLAGVLAAALYQSLLKLVNRTRIHLLELDAWTRTALIAVGAFGAYSLGANNIANVVGVFVHASPFRPLNLGPLYVPGSHQLFFLGGLSVAAGIFTFSRRVMSTVGHDLFRLTPLMALVVVLAHSLALYVFASRPLQIGLSELGLPTIPLVPVSSSQAVIGALLGIGLLRGGRNVNVSLLGKIAFGWVSTPLVAAVITFVALFFVQNVFEQEVVRPRERTAAGAPAPVEAVGAGLGGRLDHPASPW